MQGCAENENRFGFDFKITEPSKKFDIRSDGFPTETGSTIQITYSYVAYINFVILDQYGNMWETIQGKAIVNK